MITLERVRAVSDLSFLHEGDWFDDRQGFGLKNLIFVIDQVIYVAGDDDTKKFRIFKELFGDLSRYEKELIFAIQKARSKQDFTYHIKKDEQERDFEFSRLLADDANYQFASELIDHVGKDVALGASMDARFYELEKIIEEWN